MEKRKRKVKFFWYWQVREMKACGLSILAIAQELDMPEYEVLNMLKPMNAKVVD